MAIQPADISAILNAFGQLGQANAAERQRDLQAQAERRSALGALGGLVGGIGGGLATEGNPYAAMAGSVAGSALLSGGRAPGAQTINQAGQAFSMAQQQQAYQQQQQDRSAVERAGALLSPTPVTTQTSPIVGDETKGTPAPQTQQSQPPPDYRGAARELFNAGQLGPAISLLAQQQKAGAAQAYTVVDVKPDGNYQPGQIPRSALGGTDIPTGSMVQKDQNGVWHVVWQPNQAVSGDAADRRFMAGQIAGRMGFQPGTPQYQQAFTQAYEGLSVENAGKPIVGPQGQSPGINVPAIENNLRSQYGLPPIVQGAPIPAPQAGVQASQAGALPATKNVQPLTGQQAAPPVITQGFNEKKPITPEQQSTLTLAGESRRTVNAAMQRFMPDGKVDPAEVAKGYLGIPWTDARTAQSDLVTAMGNIIYLKSGKAINMEEAKRNALSYLPTPFDNAEGQKAAMQRIKALSDDVEWLSQYGLRPDVAKDFFARQEAAKPKNQKLDNLKTKYGLD